VRKVSERINENSDDEPSIDQLNIIIFESYGYDFPKTTEEINEIINKISQNNVMAKGSFKFNFSVKNIDNSVILVEKKSTKTIIPSNDWVKVIKRCHIKIKNNVNKHRNFEKTIKKVTKQYMIPETAIIYLSKFACKDCYNNLNHINESINQSQSMTSFSSFFGRLKL
jgi:hypothetical protein